MSRIKSWVNGIIHINRYQQEIKDRFGEIESRFGEIENRFGEIENRLNHLERQNARRAEEAVELSKAINDIHKNIVQILSSDKKGLAELNKVLSITPTVWGDESKLIISEKAAVNSCFFNTNSGYIRIGDYTFAGSGVSVLAGTHDSELSGFLRRDIESNEGCNIDIGKGVWLASNATVLGPCIIEDDAVIAAGAVVVPGTHVCKGELYAGVPARKVRDLRVIKNVEDHPQKLAELIDREQGVLFFSGWTEKVLVKRDEREYWGHKLESGVAEIYTDRDELDLIFVSDNESDVEVFIENRLIETVHAGPDPLQVEIETGVKSGLKKITIRTEEGTFVANGN